MNLQETVSKIVGKEVSVEDAMLFAKEQFGLIATYLRSNDPKFPNGFTSWRETHYHFATIIEKHLEKYEDNRNYTDKIFDTEDSHGMGGLWELADEWTNKFELKYKDVVWGEELEYFDMIEEFFDEQNSL